jgi:hypothetical protein
MDHPQPSTPTRHANAKQITPWTHPRQRKEIARWSDNPLSALNLGGSQDKLEAAKSGKVNMQVRPEPAHGRLANGWK